MKLIVTSESYFRISRVEVSKEHIFYSNQK
jgi:hypothetical protein